MEFFDSVDSQTFAVGGAIFVLIGIAKAIWPKIVATPEREKHVLLAILALGMVAGVIFFRGVSVAGEDAIVTGLRRGLSASAAAFLFFFGWKLGPRAIFRFLKARFGFGKLMDKCGDTPVIQLDPRRPRRSGKPGATKPPKGRA